MGAIQDCIQPTRTGYAAVVEGVTKSYGSLNALDDISLAIPSGEIIGLVGPNGSGKTTLLEILLGKRAATRGQVTVLGLQPHRDRRQLHRRIGVVFQSVPVPSYVTPRELVRLFAVCHSVPYQSQLLEEIGLAASAGKQVQLLSGGQKQRLSLLLSLIGKPELLILDEPTSSLDPQARRVAWRLIRDHSARGERTVIMSSQSMEEAQSVCDRVIVIDGGRIRAFDRVNALVEKYAPGYRVMYSVPGARKNGFDQELLKATRERDGRIECDFKVRSLAEAEEAIGSARKRFNQDMVDLTVRPSTLDDVFLNLTGRELRD